MMTPPKIGQSLGEAIGGSRTIVIDGAGHSMMSEKPDAILDALIEFMN
jgi:pimeloyl-ACP methyl ester carboxylesterase